MSFPICIVLSPLRALWLRRSVVTCRGTEYGGCARVCVYLSREVTISIKKYQILPACSAQALTHLPSWIPNSHNGDAQREQGYRIWSSWRRHSQSMASPCLDEQSSISNLNPGSISLLNNLLITMVQPHPFMRSMADGRAIPDGDQSPLATG